MCDQSEGNRFCFQKSVCCNVFLFSILIFQIHIHSYRVQFSTTDTEVIIPYFDSQPPTDHPPVTRLGSVVLLASIASFGEASTHWIFERVFSDISPSLASQIPRISRDAASCFLQQLLRKRKMVSANICCHKSNSKLQQRLIVEYGFWNAIGTRLSVKPSAAKLSGQTLLSVNKAWDKKWRIREAHNCGYLQVSELELKGTTTIFTAR